MVITSHNFSKTVGEEYMERPLAIQDYRSGSFAKPPPRSRGSGWGLVTPAVTIQAAKEIKSLNPSVKEVLNMAGS